MGRRRVCAVLASSLHPENADGRGGVGVGVGVDVGDGSSIADMDPLDTIHARRRHAR